MNTADEFTFAKAIRIMKDEFVLFISQGNKTKATQYE